MQKEKEFKKDQTLQYIMLVLNHSFYTMKHSMALRLDALFKWEDY